MQPLDSESQQSAERGGDLEMPEVTHLTFDNPVLHCMPA